MGVKYVCDRCDYETKEQESLFLVRVRKPAMPQDIPQKMNEFELCGACYSALEVFMRSKEER